LAAQTTATNQKIAQLAFRFVLTVGVVNFFADFTYEGARSIMGPFLGTLGASAAAVGFVAGFGEMLGYVLRIVSGFFAQKTHRYWTFAFLGYFVNMLAVPALALAGNWPVAAALMIAERTGRAIRKPAVETMLSYATKSMGRGWVFGFNEALDQAGATLGPLIVALVLYWKDGYRTSFVVLLIPALLCLSTIILARILHPRPHEMETDESKPKTEQSGKFSSTYWLYLIAGGLIAAGFADFSLMAFHFQKASVVSSELVPVLYAIAMATAAVAALIFGRLLDRIGFPILVFAFLLAAFAAPFAFSDRACFAVVGMILWGAGLGAQESLLKAELTAVVAANQRSSAFGLFDGGFGIAWFLGSAAMGLLYERSIPALMIFSVLLQLAALPVFLIAQRSAHR
jgi:predicted MFS family arabinose efflux permease